MPSTNRDLTNLKISESFYRLMQTDPVDDVTLIDGTGSLVTYLVVSGTIESYYFKGDGSQLTNLPSSSLPSGLISSSAQIGLSPSDSPFFANLTVGGKITAQEFYTEYISASVIYESGSTKFGDSLDDTHSFTGSLRVLGSITGSVFGNLFGTASFSNTASYISPLFISASVAAQGLTGVSDWADITNKPSDLVSSSAQTISNLFGTNIVSGSGQRNILGLAETDSPTFANANFTGNVVVSGTLTARTYIISSSVINYQTIEVSGSSKFGDTLDDIHQFTGSLFLTGSSRFTGGTAIFDGDQLEFTGSAKFTGSLQVYGEFILPTTNELPLISTTGSLIISASSAYLYL